MSSSASFSYPVAVKFSEIDLAGVVFNSHYLTWCEDAKMAFLDDLGYGPYWFTEHGRLGLVRHAEIDWVASLKPLDRADIRVSVERLGTSSFTCATRSGVPARTPSARPPASSRTSGSTPRREPRRRSTRGSGRP